MTTNHWEHFVHGADIGIRGLGRSREAAFEQAALALTAVVTEPCRIEPKVSIDIRCSAPDEELLLVDWLNALVFEMATRHMLFSRFEVSLDGNVLRARAWGEAIDQQKHEPAVEVKGATYTDLRVVQADVDEWSAQCVVDV